MYVDHRFKDREQAGQVLATLLRSYADRADVIVIGLARGGVPVAREVALALHAQLEVIVVRKLGVPGQPELAMGAIGPGGLRVISDEIMRGCGVSARQLAAVTAREQAELARREHIYRENRPPLNERVRDRCVILVDDGIATGLSMRAAIQAIAQLHPSSIVVAAPVAALDACDGLRDLSESGVIAACVCALKPTEIGAVGFWYDRFDQTQDDQVCAALRASDAEDRRDGAPQ